MKKILVLLTITVLTFMLMSCNNNTEVNAIENQVTNEAGGEGSAVIESENETSNEAVQSEEETAEGQSEVTSVALDTTAMSDENRPVVTMNFEDGRTIVLKLVPEIAPNTVNSFLTLINDGYYDGLIFHRVIKGFMIQGGDPQGTGTGGPGFTIKDEFYKMDEEAKTVEFLPHARGVLSMAKTGAPDSAGSQFFIVHQDAHNLNGQYAAFGFVTEGLDVLDALASVATGANDKPEIDITIKSVTVELNGYVLTEPELIK